MPDNSRFEGRFAGVLILAAALLALLFMMHHPTGGGGDDGHLLRDWSNALVHGAMIVCLLVLLFGFSILSRRLGEQHLSVRAAQMAFAGAAIAMAGAALVSGFAVPQLAARVADPAALSAQFATLAALNQAAAKLGIALTGAALALWSVRLLRLDLVSKIAGGLGLLLALGALALLHHAGVGLHPMAHAVLAFTIWSVIIAAQLIRGKL